MPAAARRLAVLGVGRIGLPVTANLIAAGFPVVAFDARPEVRCDVEAVGAGWADSATAACADAAVVITVLPGSPELRGLMLGTADGAGLLSGLAAGTAWVDLTSAAPDLGVELAAAARRFGVGYLEAPVGGGVDAAVRGELTLYVGGEAALLAATRPVLGAIADRGRIHHMGGPGRGYVTKLLVNLLWFGQAVATTEALLVATRAGIDVAQLREVLLSGPAASEFVRAVVPALLDGNYLASFGLDRCLEELESIERFAADQATPFDLSRLVTDVHRNALQRYGPVDGELLAAAYLEEQAGVRLRDARLDAGPPGYVQIMTHGVPASDLSDDDLSRELRHAHEKRHDIFVDGTVDQLRNHSARTHELEQAYLDRFADKVKDAAEKARL